MDDTADTNRTLQALRKREATLRYEIEIAQARLAEVCANIEIVQRAGRGKPGPKPRNAQDTPSLLPEETGAT